jgi:TatA/E family protein of Tat protein translocase
MLAFLGPLQIIVLMAVLLLVFGPDKMPEIGKQMGKALRELMKAKQEFMDTIHFDDDKDHDRSYNRPHTYDDYSANDYSPGYNSVSDGSPSTYQEALPPAPAAHGDFVAPAFADTEGFETAPPATSAKATSGTVSAENASQTFVAPGGTVAREK